MSRPHHRVALGWTPPDGSPRRTTFLERCSVGRDPDNDIIIASSSVSRQHVRLSLVQGALTLHNVSRSQPVGLSLGSVAPGQSTRLGPGDTFTVGGTSLCVLDLHDGVQDGPSQVCRNPTCRRQVSRDHTDCPWCGTSLAFARTVPDSRGDD